METKQPKNQVNEAAEQAQALKNAKRIKIAKYASIGVLAVVAGVLVYIFAFRNPAIEKGREAIAQSDVAMLDSMAVKQSLAGASDSISLAKEAAITADLIKKYEAVAQGNSHDAGNRAHLMVAILSYENGDYKKALEHLEEYSTTGAKLDVGVFSLKGDCHVNLKQYDEALECYEDAISEADENPVLTPFIMSKQARIYNEKKDHAKELEIYETIKKEYPKYTIIEVDKYIERAKALGAKK